MPGWSVVLKKETRGRRINSTEDEHGLGQDGGRDDMQVFTNMDLQGGGTDAIAGDEVAARPSNGRRRNWNKVN